MTKPLIFIQARLDSTRLPAKALLPLAGTPSAILCALRAGNTGLNTCVLTSSNNQNSPLIDMLERYNINYQTGSTTNVFSRFLNATNQHADNTPIVRLTADNCFPDGKLIEETLHYFLSKNLYYLTTLGSDKNSKTPYGLGVEIFRAKLLREIATSLSDDDKEHVTPSMIKKYHKTAYNPAAIQENMSHYRCTLDTFEDYVALHNLFCSIKNPVTIPWEKLCELLMTTSKPTAINGQVNTRNITRCI